jgi:phage repressor protein C with HTH and peptisase S24 domain
MILDRLKDYIAAKGISISAFEKSIGMSNASFGKSLKNNGAIGTDKLENILNVYSDINIEWLLTGNGEMLKSDRSKGEEERKYRSRHLIPLYDISAIGGRQYDADMTAVSNPAGMVDTGDWFLDATAAMSVQGESMSPEYKPGSIVALKEVKDWQIIMYGEDYVIETDEIRVIKRIQHSDHTNTLMACSINMEEYENGPLKGHLVHEPFEIPLESIRRMYLVLGEVRRNHSFKIINVMK